MAVRLLTTAYADAVASYATDESSLVVILLDRDRRIVECSLGLLRLLRIEKRPLGRRLSSFATGLADTSSTAGCDPFAAPADIPEGIQAAVAVSRTRLTLATPSARYRSLDCRLIDMGDHLLLIGEPIEEADDRAVAKLGELNSELADLSRDLTKKNIALERANARITELMNTDPLTGTANRRRLNEILDRELSFARRHGHALSLIIIDVDHFKRVNDAGGHDAGDRVLAVLADTLRANCRAEDLAARFGGDEFCVVLTGTGADDAAGWMERVRERFAATGAGVTTVWPTLSAGVAGLAAGDDTESLMKRADDALYEAKHGGRDRVTVA